MSNPFLDNDILSGLLYVCLPHNPNCTNGSCPDYLGSGEILGKVSEGVYLVTEDRVEPGLTESRRMVNLEWMVDTYTMFRGDQGSDWRSHVSAAKTVANKCSAEHRKEARR